MLILVEMAFSTKFNLVQLSYKPTKFILWSGAVPVEYRETIQLAEMYAICHLSDLIRPIGSFALDINTDNLNVLHNLQKGRSNRSIKENDLIRQIAKNFNTKNIF